MAYHCHPAGELPVVRRRIGDNVLQRDIAAIAIKIGLPRRKVGITLCEFQERIIALR